MPELKELRRNEALAQHTTYKIGGPADYFYVAKNKKELTSAVNQAVENGLDYFILGVGANILVGDKGFRGLVIKNEADNFNFDGELLVAESGAIVAELIDACEKRGLSGLEHFAGIPSTVGGALRQNLHFLSPDRESTLFIGDILDSAEILDENNQAKKVGQDFFEFGYDYSILHKRKYIVMTAAFRLSRGKPEDIRKQFDENISWRKEKQPQLSEFPSCGSVFKKIEGVGAGRLIEQCGLKGRQVGGIKISEKHANYFVNTGGGTARDVRELIEYVRDVVKKETGHVLEPEISFVGEF